MKPLISIILPTYNEGHHIDATLRSLLAQEQSRLDIEILVVDGGSDDDTVSRVAPFLADIRVKLLRNPSRTAPAAFNMGLRAAGGEYVAILGAHASYAPNYIDACYQEMMAHNAVGCSGSVVTVPANQTASARLASWCLAHAFASSPNSVRTQTNGFVDTIAYPVFRKAALLELGGYNEQLVRNQDNDMNHRLRTAGHRLYLTSKTKATYVARSDVRALWKYAYLSGKWNAYTLRINPSCMHLRHFAPFGFLTFLATFAAAALLAQLTHHASYVFLALLAVVLSSHLAFGFIAGIQNCLQARSLAALLLPFVILGFHLAYGLGTLAGSAHLLRGVYPAANPARAAASS